MIIHDIMLAQRFAQPFESLKAQNANEPLKVQTFFTTLKSLVTLEASCITQADIVEVAYCT